MSQNSASARCIVGEGRRGGKPNALLDIVVGFVGNVGTKVRRYNWYSAGSLGWPFLMLNYKYISQIKYTEAILSNSTRKLLWFEITKMLIAV